MGASMPGILVILNPRAGSAGSDEDVQKIEDVLRSDGASVRVLRPKDGDALVQAAEQAPNCPEEIIVATGGDGTISLVASHLAGTPKRLGVLPGGTLNHFAKDLNIPAELDEAARIVLAGHTIAVDMAEVNGRAFINNSSLGFYPAFVRFREAGQQAVGNKWLAAIPALFRAFGRHTSLNVDLTVDGQPIHRSTPVVFVGNNEYCVEGLDIGRRDSLGAGKLCVVIAKPEGRWHVFFTIIAALLRKVRQSDGVDILSARNVVVDCRRKNLPVAIDGEVVTLENPLRYTIRPKALNVIVPAGPSNENHRAPL